MKTHAFLITVIVPVLIILAILGSTPMLSAQSQVVSVSVTLPVVVGKDLRLTTFTGEDGLSSGYVFDITQDDSGFLWFATTDGLARFDGYTFRNYRSERNNPNSLSSNSLLSILQGNGGVLWLTTTSNGVDRFDPATETFTHYRHDPTNINSLSGNNIPIFGLFEDQEGILWISTLGSGLNRLDPASETFRHYSHDPQDSNSLSSNSLAGIYQDSNGMMWIGTRDAGLNQLDPVTGQIIRHLPNAKDPNSVPGGDVRAMYEDRTGTFWLATSKGFGTLDRQTGRFVRYAIVPHQSDAASLNSVMQFLEDFAGNLWIGTEGAGILKFDRQKRQVVQYKNDPNNPHSLQNNFISSFHQDPSGTFWVGTFGGGLNMFSTRQPKFAHYKHEADAKSVTDNFILSIFEDHTGIVWIGNDRTLNRWDRRTDTWQVYRNDPNKPASISNGSVTATQEDPEGTLWFGTYSGGLNRFDPKTGKFKAYMHDSKNPNSLSDNIIRSICLDSNGILWVGGWNNGLNRFDRATETFKRYRYDPDNPASLGGDEITDIFEDRAKTLWVGTEDGLNRFDPATEKFTRFQNDPQNPLSLPDNAVRVLFEDRSGQFWVGTAGGLCSFDRESAICTVYTDKEGLPNNTIEGILEDEQGNLWISTNNGLSCFNIKTKTFRNYDSSDGLQSNEFNIFTAFYKSHRTGEMYFGGINGFNVFDPGKVEDNLFVPPVVLTDFRLFNVSVPVGGNSVLQKTINATDELSLSYNQNSLSFEFSALSYVASAKNQYRYWLEGFDTVWHNVSSKERLAVYTNLHADDYIFRVQGTNEDGVWNEKGKSIQITIMPPWWGTWWFRSLGTVLVLLLAYSLFLSRVRNIKKHNLKLESEVAERTRQLQIANTELEAFAYSVSHDLRTPLRGIDGFSQILLEEYQDRLDDQGKNYLHRVRSASQRLAHLIDDMLNLSHIGREKMNIGQVNLSKIAQEIASELRENQPEREVKFIIQEGIYVQGDSNLLRIVMENLIENAWKYTSKHANARIEFGVQQQNEMKVYFISDDGAGFDMNYAQKLFGAFQRLHATTEFPGTGIGLATVQRVIHRHGGKVWAEGEVEKGSTFYFTVC